MIASTRCSVTRANPATARRSSVQRGAVRGLTHVCAASRAEDAAAGKEMQLQHVAMATKFLALTLATGLMAEPVLAADLGKQVFNNNCAACHQGGRNSVIPDHTLDKEALEQYLAGGFKLEAIINQVTNGKGAMPAWENTLEEEEIEAVSKYVFDTANAGAWGSQ